MTLERDNPQARYEPVILQKTTWQVRQRGTHFKERFFCDSICSAHNVVLFLESENINCVDNGWNHKAFHGECSSECFVRMVWKVERRSCVEGNISSTSGAYCTPFQPVASSTKHSFVRVPISSGRCIAQNKKNQTNKNNERTETLFHCMWRQTQCTVNPCRCKMQMKVPFSVTARVKAAQVFVKVFGQMGHGQSLASKSCV